MTHPADFRHCPPCEVASLDDACWMCGGPTKAGPVPYRSTVPGSAQREADRWRERQAA